MENLTDSKTEIERLIARLGIVTQEQLVVALRGTGLNLIALLKHRSADLAAGESEQAQAYQAAQAKELSLARAAENSLWGLF